MSGDKYQICRVAAVTVVDIYEKSALSKGLIAVVAAGALLAPTCAYIFGIRELPVTNSALTTSHGIRDGWKTVSIAGEAMNDRLPLRAGALKVDSFIDRSLFKEQTAFGGAATPEVLEGSDGHLFLAGAFDAACGPHGTPQSVSSNLKRFADIIAKSGRKIVITIAPDKSSIEIDKLPKNNPKADCWKTHQDQLWNALSGAQIPGYIDLRSIFRGRITKTRAPLYLRQDSHWNREGSLVAIEKVVTMFQPGVWNKNEIKYNGQTEYGGDLEAMRGGTKTDEAPDFVVNRPQISVVKSQYDEGYSPGYRRLSEMSGPPGSLITGKTLMLFDSFGMAAIEQIVPYFEKLDTMHFSNFAIDLWVDLIEAAENVWLLTVERSLEYRLTYDMGSAAFLDALDKALNG